MEDGAPYRKGVASVRRKELEKMGWIGWGPGTWPSNPPDLNPIENIWHILRSNIRKRKRQPRNRKELIEGSCIFIWALFKFQASDSRERKKTPKPRLHPPRCLLMQNLCLLVLVSAGPLLIRIAKDKLPGQDIQKKEL
jgi:hypothetical protein